MFRWTILTAMLATLGFTGTVQAQQWRDSRLVESFYPRYLGREAFVSEMRHWQCHLDEGMSVGEIEVQILGGPDFYARCGGTPEGYVGGLFTAVVGTQPCRKDMDYWMSRYPICNCRKKLARELLAWARPAPAPVVVAPPAPVVPPEPIEPAHVPAYGPAPVPVAVPVAVPVPHHHHRYPVRPGLSIRFTLPIR